MLLRIGHRGAGGHAPENTLAAIERGIALHAHLVKFDVRATSDGQLVLLHDATLDRTTNGQGPIADQLWSNVKQLTCDGGQPLPLLADALRAASGRTGVMIEIKAEGVAKQVCRIVQEIQFSGPVIYASFLPDELLAIRRDDPQAQTMALIEAVPVNRTAFATDAQAIHVGVAFEVLTPSFLLFSCLSLHPTISRQPQMVYGEKQRDDLFSSPRTQGSRPVTMVPPFGPRVGTGSGANPAGEILSEAIAEQKKSDLRLCRAHDSHTLLMKQSSLSFPLAVRSNDIPEKTIDQGGSA